MDPWFCCHDIPCHCELHTHVHTHVHTSTGEGDSAADPPSFCTTSSSGCFTHKHTLRLFCGCRNFVCFFTTFMCVCSFVHVHNVTRHSIYIWFMLMSMIYYNISYSSLVDLLYIIIRIGHMNEKILRPVHDNRHYSAYET